MQLWRDYSATALGMIGRALTGDSWTLRSYVEMAYPEHGSIDNRSAQEIIEDFKEKFAS